MRSCNESAFICANLRPTSPCKRFIRAYPRSFAAESIIFSVFSGEAHETADGADYADYWGFIERASRGFARIDADSLMFYPRVSAFIRGEILNRRL